MQAGAIVVGIGLLAVAWLCWSGRWRAWSRIAMLPSVPITLAPGLGVCLVMIGLGGLMPAAIRGAFWQYADSELPGLRPSMLLQAAILAQRLGHAARAQSAIREYYQVRASADRDLPETLQARESLAGLPSQPNQKNEE